MRITTSALRRPSRRLAVVLALTWVTSAPTQTWNAPNSGPTSDPLNWSPGVPANSVDSVWTFGGSGSQSYGVLNDLPINYALNGINFLSSSPNLISFSPGLVTPSNLNFSASGAAVNPFFNQNSPGPVFFTTPMTLSGNLQYGGGGAGTVLINNSMTGASRTITKSGPSRLIINLDNSTTLTGTPVYNLNAGVIQIAAFNRLGTNTVQLNFDGGALAFSSASTTLTGGTRVLTFNAGGGTIDVMNPAQDVQIQVTNNFFGTGSLFKTGNGTFTLAGANASWASPIFVNQGTFRQGADGALGSGDPVEVAPGATFAYTTTTGYTAAAAGNRDVNATGFGFIDATVVTEAGLGTGAVRGDQTSTVQVNRTINLNGTSSINVSGTQPLVLNNPVTASIPTSRLVKEGRGVLSLTAAGDYGGGTGIRYGTLELNGANGALPALTGTVTIGGLAVTTADHFAHLNLRNTTAANPDRVGDTRPINLLGGAALTLSNNALPVAETVGPVTMQNGHSTFSLVTTTGGSILTFGSLTRDGRATATIRADNLGSAVPDPGPSPVAGNTNLFVTNPFAAGDFVGDPLNPQGQPILRWGAGQTIADSAPREFVTYTPDRGFRPLAAGQYFNPSFSTFTGATAGTNAGNIKLTAATTLTGDALINALHMDGRTLNTNSFTFLGVQSGLVVNRVTNISVNPAFNANVLDFGQQEAVILGQGINVNAYVIAKNGLTRGASIAGTTPSSVVLSQPNVIDGPITLNGLGNGLGTGIGRLVVDNISALGNPANPWNFSGGSLILRGVPDLTLTNPVTIHDGGVELNLGAGATDPGPIVKLATPLTGSGRLNKTGAGTLDLRGVDNSAFTGVVRAGVGYLTFDQANNLGTGHIDLNNGRLLALGAGSRDLGNRAIAVTSNPTFGVESGDVLLRGPLVGPSGNTLTKVGSGTLVLEGDNLFLGNLTVSGSPTPRMPTATGGGVVFRKAGNYRSGAQLQVNSTAFAQLDNAAVNNADRFRDDTALTLGGGTLRFIGNAIAPTHELTGTLNIGASSGLDATRSRITLEPGVGQLLVLAPSSLARNSTRSQLLLTGPIPQGSNPLNWLGGGTANVIPLSLGTHAALVGGNGTGPLVSILPGAMGDPTAGGNGSGFLTYNPIAGLRLLDAAEYTNAITSGATDLTNVRTTASIGSIDTPTTINSLILDGGHAVGGSAILTVNSGTIASLGNGSNAINTGLAPAATATALNLFVNSDLALNGVVSGTANGLHKSGPGTLTFAPPSANTFSGNLIVSGGTVAAALDNHLGASGNAVFLDGGTLRWDAAFNTNRFINVLAGGGTLDVQNFAVTIGASGTPGVGHTSTVSAVGPVTKVGTGTVTFGSLSSTSFAGGMTVQVGEVVFNASQNNISNAAPLTIVGGAALRFNGATADVVGSIAGAGTLDLATPAGFALTVGESATAAITPDATFSGTITGNGLSAITKGGLGTWTINPGSTPSSFAGTWTVAAGTILLGGDAPNAADGVLGNGTTPIVVGQTGTTQDPAALLTSGPFTIGRPINIRAGGANNSQLSILGTAATSGTTTLSGPITLGTNAMANHKLTQIQAPGDSTVAVTGPVTITTGYTGVATVEKTGTGTLVMANAGNTYTGRTVLTAGTLSLAADGTPADGPIGVSTLVINGGTLTAGGSGRTVHNAVIVNNNLTVGGLQPLTFSTGQFALGLGQRTINVEAPILTVNGILTGSQSFNGLGTLIKTGPGVMVVTNANTYGGGTTVQAGTFRVNNTTGSGTGTGAVAITGGTLTGTGTSTGPIMLASGTLAPGNAVNIGTLTTTTQPMFSGGLYTANLAGVGTGNYGQLNVTAAGDLDIGFTTELGVTSYNAAPDGAFTIIAATGSAVNGRFMNYATDLSPVFVNSTTLTQYLIYYGSFPGQPGSVVIAPVPEPATVLAWCGLSAAAVTAWRRRRRRREI